MEAILTISGILFGVFLFILIGGANHAICHYMKRQLIQSNFWINVTILALIGFIALINFIDLFIE